MYSIEKTCACHFCASLRDVRVFINVLCVVRLCSLEADRSNDKGETCYLIEWYIESRIFLVVGHHCNIPVFRARHKPLYNNALLPCSDDVAFVPLQELLIGKNRTGYHVAGIEMWVHGEARHLDHEIHLAVAELGNDIVFFHIFLLDREISVPKAGGSLFGNQGNRFYVCVFPYCCQRFGF